MPSKGLVYVTGIQFIVVTRNNLTDVVTKGLKVTHVHTPHNGVRRVYSAEVSSVRDLKEDGEQRRSHCEFFYRQDQFRRVQTAMRQPCSPTWAGSSPRHRNGCGDPPGKEIEMSPSHSQPAWFDPSIGGEYGVID